ncbi:BatA domain-containing protein [Flagellimonas halotolerans]|uniref:BatA domain-containing protein n=1 Tax=Flagellimonas halotolerans TaxID=3112164 RepID=A0ABU6INI8_9FLAO|nr:MULTISPECIES: BatA domain-containing protein [unclassified Allomuricauda]MEC3964683.1 BatA domain-containing protein [Muricauda sp. SYSU M86414]MEC4264552.1 BatA domain-containing protein [Muricauda sp. SYSU M84420]
MQFKHPEILWALFLLVIPILIHLFQLRRFTKTPFTNVAMLQKVVSESRKSNTLKKWLLLFTRLLLLAAIIIAFAQPFTSATTALQEKETVVYLDDSFSMQAKNNGISLLEKAVQDLIKNIDGDTEFSLFTNEKAFNNVRITDIQNSLLSLPYSYKQLNLNEIGLKANSLFSQNSSSIKNLIVISDFQERVSDGNTDLDTNLVAHFVPMQPQEIQNNVSIDSVFVDDGLNEQAKLKVFLSGGNENNALPISLYNDEELIAKTAAKFKSNGDAEVEFTIPASEELNGRLSIIDNALGYDNRFYFNINSKEKIKVLAISESDSDYLKRLFRGDEFDFQKYALNQLDYSNLDNQNVVVLDNLATIPSGLQNILRTFKNDGGTLIIVPAINSNLSSYNTFLSSLSTTQFSEKITSDAKLTTITFDHPLYRNVFEQEVTNFQYPSVKEHFSIQTTLPKALSLEGGDSFLSGDDGLYVFTVPLALDNSNFINSPLIVPTFYNMAQSSLQTPKPYQTLGESTTVDISAQIGNDDILEVSKAGYGFIPLQQTFPNRVRLTFDQNPTEDGIFFILQNEQRLQNISFNYPRAESQLKYMDIGALENANTMDSVPELFEYLEAENNITAYWKWFVILALLLALIEVLIQKFVT